MFVGDVLGFFKNGSISVISTTVGVVSSSECHNSFYTGNCLTMWSGSCISAHGTEMMS